MSSQNFLQNHLKSNFALTFQDLYECDGLAKLEQKFNEYLSKKNSEIAEKFFSLKQKNTNPRHLEH